MAYSVTLMAEPNSKQEASDHLASLLVRIAEHRDRVAFSPFV
jgi:hypothetical protein